MADYTVLATLKAQGSVLEIKTFDGYATIFDSSYCLLRLDTATLKPTSKTIIKKGLPPLYAYSKSTSICKSGAIVMSIDGGSKAFTLSLKDGTLKKEGVFEYFRGGVIASAFSSSCEFCMCGSDLGEIALFNYQKLNPIGAFDMQGDYVSQIVFSDNDRFCAVSYFDKRTIIYDMLELHIACQFTSDAVIERALYSPILEAFVCVSRGGDVEAISPSGKKKLFVSKDESFWGTDIAMVGEDVVALSSREGRIYFFDTAEKEFLKVIYPMETIGVSKLHRDEDKLFIGMSGGEIIVVDMSVLKDEFDSAVKAKDFAKADELIGKNLFLLFDKEYKEKLKAAWEPKKDEIIDLIRTYRSQEAYALAKPYLRFKAIKDEFESIMAQGEEVVQFFEALKSGDYPHAYKIANLSKSIKQLKAYAELEGIFENTMKKAITLMEEDELKNRAYVLNLLKPFATIPSKKDTVSDLVKNWDKYKDFVIALKTREFGSAFTLSSRFPFLQETTAYKKTVAMGDNLMQKLTALEGAKEFEQALETSKLLENFTPYKTAASLKSAEFTSKIRALKIIEEYKQKRLTPIGIASFVDQNPYLDGFEDFDRFLLLMQDEIKALYEDNKYNAEEFWNKTKQYAYIAKLKNFTLTLLRETYLEELKTAAIEQPASIDWRASFEKFGSFFEIDAKTEAFAKNMGVKADIKEREKNINIEILPKSMLAIRKS